MQLAGFEIPATALIDLLVSINSGGPQRGDADPVDAEKHGYAMLGRVDTVDADLVVDGDQSLFTVAVERGAQIGEYFTVTGKGGTGMAKRRNPPVAVALGVKPVVPGSEIQDRRTPRRGVEQVFLLISHGHNGSL